MSARPSILVVNDESGIRKMIAEVLGLEQYPVATVANGREALDFLAANPGRYIILLDTLMPVMDGFEMLEQLERLPEERAKHKIILTYVLKPLKDLPIDGTLAVPFTVDQLLFAIEAVELL